MVAPAVAARILQGLVARGFTGQLSSRALEMLARQEVARARRQVRIDVRIESFARQVEENLRRGIQTRIELAAQLLRDQVVQNVSIPVVRGAGSRGGKQKARSRPGEFPRADTKRLMRDVFWETERDRGRVGVTLDYGLFLEINMDRSFLRRTLNDVSGKMGGMIGDGRRGPRLPGQA